jgi:AcrR family transcriptional regulator
VTGALAGRQAPAAGPTRPVTGALGGRRYAGRSSPERRAERRARLLSAALELFGTVGWAGGTVERLCREAGVATRSFYEEFDSREELLLTVYADVLDGARSAVGAALAAAPLTLPGRVEAGLAGYVGFLSRDPRRARVAHVEVRAAGRTLETQRRAAVTGFAALIEREGMLLAAAGERRLDAGSLTALALAGAVNELVVGWATTEPHPPVEPLVAELVRVFLAVLR